MAEKGCKWEKGGERETRGPLQSKVFKKKKKTTRDNTRRQVKVERTKNNRSKRKKMDLGGNAMHHEVTPNQKASKKAWV